MIYIVDPVSEWKMASSLCNVHHRATPVGVMG